jgi:transcriptional regulator with XRE-family HTH domain
MMTTLTLCSPYEALELCIKLLDLEVKSIATKAGVSESQISRYRKGKADMGTESFRKLIQALPEKAKNVMIKCLGSQEMTKKHVFPELTNKIDYNFKQGVDMSAWMPRGVSWLWVGILIGIASLISGGLIFSERYGRFLLFGNTNPNLFLLTIEIALSFPLIAYTYIHCWLLGNKQEGWAK